MTILSKNIQLIRGVSNLKQDDFARLVIPKGGTESTDKKNVKKLRSLISSYENGKAVPKIITLNNIAYVAGVSLEQLMNKELSVQDIHVTMPPREKDKAEVLNFDEIMRHTRKEMTFIKAAIKIHSLKLISLEAKIENKPFDEIFSDHERKIEQEIMRLEGEG